MYPLLHRYTFWAFLVLLGVAHALVRPAVVLVEEVGVWTAAQQLFGVNPALYTATLIILLLMRRAELISIRWSDVAVAALYLLGLMFPSATVSWLMLVLLALWLWRGRCGGPDISAAATIMLLMALREPVLSAVMLLYGEELLTVDTYLASLLPMRGDAVWAQNNILMGGEGVKLVVLSGCSSLANLSYALLFWYSVSRYFGGRISTAALLAGALVVLSVVGLNVIRLALMGHSASGYAAMHTEQMNGVISLAMLIVVVTISCLGVWYGSSRESGNYSADSAGANRSLG